MADKIVATVGSHIILLSEVEGQLQQLKQQNTEVTPETRCEILEEILFQKLLLYRAEKDSLSVSDEQVDEEMNRRIRFFIQQIGSQEKLEAYYGKSLVEIKADFRTLIKEQLLSQQMQQKITSDIKVSPSEVIQYFKNIPADSIPYINLELEIQHIVIRPKFNAEEKKEARDRAEELRQRVIAGENFGSLAVLYSQDPGSASKSGELGFFERGQMVPEFDSWAFRLKGNGVSDVFETEYGYHFMQLIERRGDLVNVRHILITPTLSIESLNNGSLKLDSIYNLISTGALTFEQAAEKFSDDEETKFNGGLMQNPTNGTHRFEEDQLNTLDPMLFSAINNLKPGECTKPLSSKDERGRTVFKLYKLKSQTEPHKANLKDDYQRLQEAALFFKKQNKVGDWVQKNVKNVFIKIDSEFSKCPYRYKWLNQSN